MPACPYQSTTICLDGLRTRSINACYKFSWCLGLPSSPFPWRPRPGPGWWRERGQLWQQEQSGLDKCERFSAGHLEWSSFPLCQQVEKFLHPYFVLESSLMAQGGNPVFVHAFSLLRGSCMGTLSLLITIIAKSWMDIIFSKPQFRSPVWMICILGIFMY